MAHPLSKYNDDNDDANEYKIPADDDDDDGSCVTAHLYNFTSL